MNDEIFNLNTFNELMSKRRDIVKKQCQKLGNSSGHNFESSQIFFLDNKNLAFCPIFKAGSTNWLINLVKLSKYPEVSN